MSSFGKLYLIPCTLGESDPQWVLPRRIKEVVSAVQHFIVENEKNARRFIKSITPEKIQSELILFSLNKHTEKKELHSFLEPCFSGYDIGIISDAGCPGIADPGADIVRIAHQNHIVVIPLVGPSSILLAMMASGMNGQNFAFNGYLPIDKKERKQKIKELERKSLIEHQSQLFIETPYRNEALFNDLITTLRPDKTLCIACDITLASEYIRTLTASQWKENPPALHKRPTLFII